MSPRSLLIACLALALTLAACRGRDASSEAESASDPTSTRSGAEPAGGSRVEEPTSFGAAPDGRPPKPLKPRPGAIAPLPPAGDSPSGPGEQLPAAERDACSLVLLEVSMSDDPGPEPVLEALRGASSPGCTRAVVDAIADDDAAMRDLAIAALDRRRGTLLQATIARLADAEAAQRDRLVEALEQISGASHGDDADAWLEWAERDSETR